MGRVGSGYWQEEPAAPSRTRPVRVALADFDVELTADRGVFAASGLDRGTGVLLRTAEAPASGGGAVDVGTGYGPIAIVMAHRQPAASVWAVDVNRRALALTRANAGRLGLANVEVAEPAAV